MTRWLCFNLLAVQRMTHPSAFLMSFRGEPGLRDRHGTCTHSVQETMMKKRLLSVPQLLFIVGTRMALGAGVALLAGGRLSARKRRTAGLTLALVGAATTIPAARIVATSRPKLLKRLAHRFA
jgi:hypothetical protein